MQFAVLDNQVGSGHPSELLFFTFSSSQQKLSNRNTNIYVNQPQIMQHTFNSHRVFLTCRSLMYICDPGAQNQS